MFATRFFNLRAFAQRFFPKLGADPGPDVNPPTGAISATSVENYIGGSMTISAIGGSIDGATPGGSAS
jgi:hypothetical protein